MDEKSRRSNYRSLFSEKNTKEIIFAPPSLPIFEHSLISRISRNDPGASSENLINFEHRIPIVFVGRTNGETRMREGGEKKGRGREIHSNGVSSTWLAKKSSSNDANS